MTASDIEKIVLAQVVVTALAMIVTYVKLRQDFRQYTRQQLFSVRLDRLRRQLSEFYGPMHMLSVVPLQPTTSGADPSDMRLVMPSAQWQSAFLEMARECEAAGEQRYALALDDFDGYLRRIEAGRRGDGLPDGWVPGTEFWLEHDGRIVGCVRLRFGLTPDLENEGGHVGYDVRPSMRRRGYGTALLRLVLIEARARGIRRVRLTCDDDNFGSIKVIERNGGALAGCGVSKETGRTVRQYWIEWQLLEPRSGESPSSRISGFVKPDPLP